MGELREKGIFAERSDLSAGIALGSPIKPKARTASRRTSLGNFSLLTAEIRAGTPALFFICPSATAAARNTNGFVFGFAFPFRRRGQFRRESTRQRNHRCLVGNLSQRDRRRTAHATSLSFNKRSLSDVVAVLLRVLPSA